MGLTREERQLLHQKSKQPTFGNGKPDSNQGNEGDIAYRQVEDSGLVQYVKQNGSWVAVGSQGDMPETRDVTRTPSGGGGVGSHNHGEFIKKDGSVAYTGNQSFGTNNITNVGTLDVNGATTLDQVTINTTDGAFAVSGANPINLTSTGSNDVNITSGNKTLITTPILDLDISRGYTADVGLTYTLNVTDTLVTTGSANMTIQATGTAANFLSLKNTNQHASSFTGINIETNSGGAANVFNNIVINCDNVATKGSDYGVTIRSENGIVIEAANANAANNKTQIKMVANGGIDIGTDTSLSPASHSPAIRTLIHGKLEIQTLYKASDASIDCSTHSVKFDQLDTPKLMRNFTYIHKTLNVTNGTTITLLASASLENTNGTTYRIIVGAHADANKLINSVYAMRMHTGTYKIADLAKTTDFDDGASPPVDLFGTIAAVSGAGITWINNTGSTVHVYATIQRIAESSDYP